MKKVLSFLICIAMLLVVCPVAALANPAQEIIIAEATTTFVTEQEAFDGDLITFRAVADGTVTVEISDCAPGYYIDFYEDSNWVSDYSDCVAGVITLNVVSGMSYEVILSSYDMEEESQVPGFITYKIASSVVTTEEAPEPDEPVDDTGSSESKPMQIGKMHNIYIKGGQTVWFSYTDSSNAEVVLNVNSQAAYTVSCDGQTIPVDEDGYVNYQMEKPTEQDAYRFSITNDATYEVFFAIRILEHPAYVNTGISLKLGDNNITLSSDAANSLYEFKPEETGEYLFTVAEGLVGNWGTSFNPVDNTEEKSGTLTWVCTSVGQTVMVGVSGTTATILNVTRSADYVPPVEVPWEYYEYTYDFSYEIPFDAEIVDIDVTDALEDVAVLDQNGFYRYGSATGPLMVADLSNVEINILDAYNYGQLRAYIYDENGVTIERIDYNDAMYEYALYGLAPVTEELAEMIINVGNTQSWWTPGGFVFSDTAPLNADSAWMAFCSYIKGSELEQGSGNVNTPDGGNGNNGTGNNGTGNNGGQNGGSSNNGSTGGNTVSGSDSHSKPSTNGASGSPGTGDQSLITVIGLAFLAVTGLVVLFTQKKRFA